ncbi:MAG: UvrD-helicase domain-containing protein [Holosporales bacterium]|nr:UvrD-helicase domain-containing protein [Holosporales bacterium]
MSPVVSNFEIPSGALDVSASCFVFASAGSGKTKLLVDRYVKSLLAGLQPSEILCITFTNAAVLEMKSRIAAVLENLYLNQNDYTREYLVNTLGMKSPTDSDVTAAEALFFKFQDEYSNLKISTIHSFCQLLIQQFALEADVVPDFALIDENEAKELILEAKNTVCNKFVDDDVIRTVSSAMSVYSFDELTDKILQFSQVFARLFEVYQDIDDYEELLKSKFVVSNDEDFSGEQLEFIRKSLAMYNLHDLFLTKSGELRKKLPFPHNEMVCEIARIVHKNSVNSRKKNLIKKTCCFLRVAKMILCEYQHLKRESNVLDFSDILAKAEYILTKSCAREFVMSKVCSFIKSIMIDEAQDLSSVQWRLISLLADDMFSGSDDAKTIFVVGDVKQSIYRFQGANYRLLAKFYKHCTENFAKSGKTLKTVYLNECYRTIQQILENIDSVFEGEIAKFAFDSDLVDYKRHVSCRDVLRSGLHNQLTLVDISGLEDKAKQIAECIKESLSGTCDDDILILTRSRSVLAENVGDELARMQTKVAMSMKGSLNDSLLSRDFMALVNVCMDTSNDYALACLLKSPYFFDNPLTNDDLFAVCRERDVSVFENLANHHPEKRAFLRNVMEHYAENNLLEFFYYLTTIVRNVGHRESHMMGTLMREVTTFRERHSSSIPEFMESFKNKNVMFIGSSAKGNGIRVSTIHGAKGLEARNVFLLDFDMEPNKSKTRMVFLDESDIFQETTEQDSLIFFIKPSRSASFDEVEAILRTEYEEEKKELLRLLYVAMTRARDNLYIFGTAEKNTAFALIQQKLETYARM